MILILTSFYYKMRISFINVNFSQLLIIELIMKICLLNGVASHMKGIKYLTKLRKISQMLENLNLISDLIQN